MTGRFAYEMPFGAEARSDGTARFRLWAPAQPAVAVVADEKVHPMTAQEGGWFELVTDAVPPGSRYMFQFDDGFRVPDPASRRQGDDVHDPSIVIDPRAFAWKNAGWKGRPWEETVLYELHPGTFTPEGSYDGIRRRLDHLVDVGVTAVELMPLADFPGRWNWGYDGVLPFAPDSSYGSVEALKTLIDEAHGRDLMVFLDVVYNHFGPEGNYLHRYAPETFTDRHHTPWGAAVDFGRREVRDFFIHNALYWLQEYRIDGLRFDAVHAILDDSETHILTELAETVRRTVDADRHVHLVLENDANESRYLDPAHYDAQWNDDFHHVAHVLATGESGGYYADYIGRGVEFLGRTLAEGFAYQGEPSAFRDGALRGEPSADRVATAFVDFVQNHDQVGNRAFGERLTRLTSPEARAALHAVLLLAPSIPLLFMGEEWGAEEPFLFFCDFGEDLADAVREGRRREFARFPQFADPAVRDTIPDPNAASAFEASRLDWSKATGAWLERTRSLLKLRRETIVPRLAGTRGAGYEIWGDTGVTVRWTMGDGSHLVLLANFADEPASGGARPGGTFIYESAQGVAEAVGSGTMPAWSVAWFLTEGRR